MYLLLPVWRLKGLLSKMVFAEGVREDGLYYLDWRGVRRYVAPTDRSLPSSSHDMLSLGPVMVSHVSSESTIDLWHALNYPLS